MATITAAAGTRTTLSTTAIDGLGSGTYVSAGVIDFSAVDPIEAVVEVQVKPGTVSGNKQAVVFLRASFDNSNFSTGPTSGTTTTDEPNLKFIGTLPLATSSTLQRGAFPIAAALGYVPPYCEIVIKNDSGAAFAGTGNGNGVYYTAYTGASA